MAAKLAEDDAITAAAADRDAAIERLTAALWASSLPERRLARAGRPGPGDCPPDHRTLRRS